MAYKNKTQDVIKIGLSFGAPRLQCMNWKCSAFWQLPVTDAEAEISVTSVSNSFLTWGHNPKG